MKHIWSFIWWNTSLRFINKKWVDFSWLGRHESFLPQEDPEIHLLPLPRVSSSSVRHQAKARARHRLRLKKCQKMHSLGGGLLYISGLTFHEPRQESGSPVVQLWALSRKLGSNTIQFFFWFDFFLMNRNRLFAKELPMQHFSERLCDCSESKSSLNVKSEVYSVHLSFISFSVWVGS